MNHFKVELTYLKGIYLKCWQAADLFIGFYQLPFLLEFELAVSDFNFCLIIGERM